MPIPRKLCELAWRVTSVFMQKSKARFNTNHNDVNKNDSHYHRYRILKKLLFAKCKSSLPRNEHVALSIFINCTISAQYINAKSQSKSQVAREIITFVRNT